MGGFGRSGRLGFPRRRATRVIAVAAVLIAGGAGAYWAARELAPGVSGPTAHGPTVIGMLPSPATRSGCIVGTPGVPRPTLSLHYGTLQANTYSVPSGTVGHVGMCYNATTGALFS